MKWDSYVDAFLLARESEGVSPKTIAWHRVAIRLFVDWIGGEDPSVGPAQLTSHHLRKYIVYLQQRPGKHGERLRPASVTSYVQSLLAFVRWLNNEELIPTNPAAKVKKPRAPFLVKSVFNKDEIDRLLTTARKEPRNGIRNAAIILLLLDSGARISELAGIKDSDIILQQGLIRVHGKGAKERMIPFSPATATAMRRYQLKARGEQPGHFYLTEEGTPFSGSGLLTILKRLGDRAGVPNTHPHRFRRTFASTFLREGGNLMALQQIMGHNSLEVTRVYLLLVSEDISREHSKASPVNAMLKRK